MLPCSLAASLVLQLATPEKKCAKARNVKPWQNGQKEAIADGEGQRKGVKKRSEEGLTTGAGPGEGRCSRGERVALLSASHVATALSVWHILKNFDRDDPEMHFFK